LQAGGGTRRNHSTSSADHGNWRCRTHAQLTLNGMRSSRRRRMTSYERRAFSFHSWPAPETSGGLRRYRPRTHVAPPGRFERCSLQGIPRRWRNRIGVGPSRRPIAPAGGDVHGS
jgi:hypothetical protein